MIDEPEAVCRAMRDGLTEVRGFRPEHGDTYYFNWRLQIDVIFQVPFHATHDSIRALAIHEDSSKHELAASLRRAFSGIVSGNVCADTISAIEKEGPFVICVSGPYLALLGRLQASFVSQWRMKLTSDAYEPCYRVVS